MPSAEFVLVDISNSFTKVAFSSRERLGRSFRLPTGELTATSLRKLLGTRKAKHAVVASVVPSRNSPVAKVLPPPVCWVSHKIPLGVGIDYPKPETIGADRLANAAAAVALYSSPAIVVDFGTAVTFDVISPAGNLCRRCHRPWTQRYDRLPAQANSPSAAHQPPRTASGYRNEHGGSHALRSNLWIPGACLRNPPPASQGNPLKDPHPANRHRWGRQAHCGKHRSVFCRFTKPYARGASPDRMPKFSVLDFGLFRCPTKQPCPELPSPVPPQRRRLQDEAVPLTRYNSRRQLCSSPPNPRYCNR